MANQGAGEAGGDGSIYKREDSRWCGKYTGANGKTRYVYAKTKAEVRTKSRSRDGLDPEAINGITTRLEQINKEKLLPIYEIADRARTNSVRLATNIATKSAASDHASQADWSPRRSHSAYP